MAFRGTCSPTNWRTDCRCFDPTDLSDFYREGSSVPRGGLLQDPAKAMLERVSLIHNGFWQAYITVRDGMLDAVRDALEMAIADGVSRKDVERTSKGPPVIMP